MTEGMETVALPWTELKQFVHPLRTLVLRHALFLVLVPHFVERWRESRFWFLVAISCMQAGWSCVRLAASRTKLLWCKRHPIDCIVSAGLNF